MRSSTVATVVFSLTLLFADRVLPVRPDGPTDTFEAAGMPSLDGDRIVRDLPLTRPDAF